MCINKNKFSNLPNVSDLMLINFQHNLVFGTLYDKYSYEFHSLVWFSVSVIVTVGLFLFPK